MTFTPTQIEAAAKAYKTLLLAERAVLASPYVSPDQVDAMKALHKALNAARRAFSNNMPFAQFLSLIGETPVNSLDTDPPADPESNDTGNKDKPDNGDD